MNPRGYIDKVDMTYFECKSKRLSRFSDEWDTFSRKINKERLEFVKTLNDEKEESLLNQCLCYWFNRSELLELRTKNKLIGATKIKKLSKEGKKIRENILSRKVDGTIGTKSIVELFARYHKMNPKGCSV